MFSLRQRAPLSPSAARRTPSLTHHPPVPPWPGAHSFVQAAWGLVCQRTEGSPSSRGPDLAAPPSRQRGVDALCIARLDTMSGDSGDRKGTKRKLEESLAEVANDGASTTSAQVRACVWGQSVLLRSSAVEKWGERRAFFF